MCFNISFNQQLKAFRQDGTILSPDGNINEEGYWNFRDWNCDPSTLGPKAKALMQLAASFAAEHPELNSDQFYVMFRNIQESSDSSYEIQIADVKGKVSSIKAKMPINLLQPAN